MPSTYLVTTGIICKGLCFFNSYMDTQIMQTIIFCYALTNNISNTNVKLWSNKSILFMLCCIYSSKNNYFKNKLCHICFHRSYWIHLQTNIVIERWCVGCCVIVYHFNVIVCFFILNETRNIFFKYNFFRRRCKPV